MAQFPSGLTREHVLKAIEAFDQGAPHTFGPSTNYDLVHLGRAYPPKAIFGLATKIATGATLKPADFNGGANTRAFTILEGLGFEIHKRAALPPFAPHSFELHKIYKRRDDIHGRFGGKQQGGISPTRTAPYIFLFTGESGHAYGYKDGWDGPVFRYTGEGRIGDMTFAHGNKAIRDHAINGKSLLLFDIKKKGVEFLGEFGCSTYELVSQPDETKKLRQAIVFHLVPVDTDERIAADSPEVDEKPAGQTLSLSELRKRAYGAAKSSAKASSSAAPRTYYHRSKDVKDYVLARAKGVCENCLLPAPFMRRNGTPYLEPHHTRRVSDNGPDHPRWVAAICPTCHRRIHNGQDGTQVNEGLMARLGSIEPAT